MTENYSGSTKIREKSSIHETNFWACKAGILFLLEENDLKDYIEMVIPDPYDAQELVAHKNEEGQAGVVGFCEGSLDSSCFREEDNQGDV